MAVPIELPELGAEDGLVRVSSWFVELGDRVEAGEQVVEVLLPVMTFDVSAPSAGVLKCIEKSLDATVKTGDILGWIAPEPISAEDGI